MWGIVLVISTMPHFITTHSINNPNYIKMQQNKNQQLDAKFRKFIKVLIMLAVLFLKCIILLLRFASQFGYSYVVLSPFVEN